MTLGFFARRLLRGAPRVWLLGVLVTLSAASLQLAWIAREGSPQIGSALLGQLHLIAYLDPDMPADELQSLSETLRRLPTVKDVRTVDSNMALQRLKTEVVARRVNGDGQAALRVEPGFLPASIEIAMAPGPNVTVDVDGVAARISRLPRVLAVDRIPDATNRIGKWRRLINFLGTGVFGLAGALALAVGASMMFRLRRMQRPRVITLTLVGATTFDLHAPAILGGALVCGLGVAAGSMLGPVAAGLFVPGFLPPLLLMGPGATGLAIMVTCALALGGILGALTIPSSRSLG